MRRPGPTRLSRRPATQAVLGTILGGFLLAAGVPSAAQQAGAAPTADPRATPATPATPAGTAGAPLLEPYRFNARERTSRALAAWEKGRPEDAVAPLDSALRLQPGDPLVEFNAGTAHLGAKQPDAAKLLEQAAKHAPPALAADALYNLGNARLSAKDARGAIDAYKGALRAQPDLGNAKRNLELALRLLEEQQRQQEQQQKDQQNDPSRDQQQKQQGGEGEGEDPQQKPEPQQPPKSDSGQNPQQPDPSQQGQPQPGGQPPPERPLPQFQDQQDMTAEQAAAILQAVENLERQQRRDQARAVARAKTSVEKDW